MGRGFTQVVTEVMGNWVVTPYALCDYRCSYCCTRVQGESRPVRDRDGAVAEVVDALAASGPDSFWAIGGLGDAYPRAEAEHGITRALVERIVAEPVRFCLVTKSMLVERDADLLATAAGRGVVTVSVSSVDDERLARIDGFAPPASERIALVHRLHAAGVGVDVNVLPWLPGLSDLDALFERLPDGVRVTVSPLLFGDWGDEVTLAGVRYRRPEVWDAYLAEYERLGHLERTSWIRPSLPPAENNPYVRMPRLDEPLAEAGELRRSLVGVARRHAEAGHVAVGAAVPAGPVAVRFA